MASGSNSRGAVIPLRNVKVEPKVFFANERTFISWLQFCGLLLMVALNLLNFGDESAKIAGSVFICIAALVALYALYRFEKRAWMINRRVAGRYDDLWGPVVLCVLLVGALIVNFYLQFGN
ncbi:vacuolar transporter chaperone 1 [Zychaea mexicana]|uniref:vacuolar transporter chaperone 1 n=1 Tax=Zychaea mexicana TaxID=64656 RepID=UPI0022FDF63A|nr:vacuolar transporter chaperone 1 [Zychaea mexicana]KAI9498999.1 vacuolar transporter chaperone 1 [Zychaea mexicana]